MKKNDNCEDDADADDDGGDDDDSDSYDDSDDSVEMGVNHEIFIDSRPNGLRVKKCKKIL